MYFSLDQCGGPVNWMTYNKIYAKSVKPDSNFEKLPMCTVQRWHVAAGFVKNSETLDENEAALMMESMVKWQQGTETQWRE